MPCGRRPPLSCLQSTSSLPPSASCHESRLKSVSTVSSRCRYRPPRSMRRSRSFFVDPSRCPPTRSRWLRRLVPVAFHDLDTSSCRPVPSPISKSASLRSERSINRTPATVDQLSAAVAVTLVAIARAVHTMFNAQWLAYFKVAKAEV